MISIEVTPQHLWLQKLVGEWTFTGEGVMGPDQPQFTMAGAESVHAVGDIWVQLVGTMENPGGPPCLNVMTLGFDPAIGRFVGTFITSMMTNLWVYDGELDEGGRVLTLSTTGPDFTTPGKRVPFRDVIEVLDDDRRTLTSFCQGDDGTWSRFMSAEYRRRA